MSFKETLTTALRKTAAHYNSGDDDNAAIVKTAQELGFNPHQTQRLVESWNTAKTINHMSKSADRTESFPLADYDSVISQLYTVKAAGFIEDQAEASFYRLEAPPIWGQHSYEGELGDGIPALAPDKPLRNSDYVPWQQKLASATAKVIAVADTFTEDARELACLREGLSRGYRQHLNKIAAFLQHQPQEFVAYQAYIAKQAQSDRVYLTVLGDVLKVLPSEPGPLLLKAAQPRDAGLAVVFMRQHAGIVNDTDDAATAAATLLATPELEQALQKRSQQVMAELVETVTGVKTAAASDSVTAMLRYDTAQPDAEFDYAQQMRMAEAWRELPQKQAQPAPGGTGSKKNPAPVTDEPMSAMSILGGGSKAKDDKKKDGDSKEGWLSGLISGVRGGVGGGLGGVSPMAKSVSGLAYSSREKATAEKENRQGVDTVQNVQRETILNDFIHLDPILRRESPEKIRAAYQTLMNVAPETSLQPEIARAVVRAAVQAVAFSPYDAKTIVELDNAVLNRVRLAKGQPLMTANSPPDPIPSKPA